MVEIAHIKAKNDIEELISNFVKAIEEGKFTNLIKPVYEDISLRGIPKATLEEIVLKIEEVITKNTLKILVMNADTSISEDDYKSGSNIIIGGNVLGRGVTFPKLQTLYYTRSAKKPQADTMWQHSRMFGYDRYPDLMRVFVTKHLYKLFSDINSGNNSIVSQVERGLDKIQLFYPEGINPTRRNVIDLQMVNLVTGGTNYYPNNPDNTDTDKLNSILSNFDNQGYYQVSLKLILELLSCIIPSEDFNLVAFEGAIKAILSKTPTAQGIIIVRRDRAVTQGTGSLLSPNDRTLGDSFKDKVVLTLYEIKGQHGWKRDCIWVPNIKLPEFLNFYDVQ